MIVKFFPKSEHPAIVCNHRHNADLTITEQTDTLQSPSRYVVEFYGYKNNISVGAFIGPHYINDYIGVYEMEEIGNIRCDIYLNVDALGGDYQEAMSVILPWFINLTNRLPSSASFAMGNESLSGYTINDFLTGRNSQTGESQYGEGLGSPNEAFTRANYANLNSTTRWFDQGLSWGDVETILATVISEGGWFRNFTHWHNLSAQNITYKQDEFYQTLNNTLSQLGKKAHFCSFGEASEYMAYRELISRVACYDSANGTAKVAIEVDDLYLQDRINTPVSIKVDLSGSLLSGKDIFSKNAIIENLGGDEYIVEVPFRIDQKDNKIMVVELVEGDPDYRATDPPIATKTTTSNSIAIEADRDVYATLFYKSTGADDETIKVYERRIIRSVEHVFEGLDLSSYDYSIGIADKFQNMNIV